MGTKSILFGAHCWFIHPWFVAAGWTSLYGFPWDPRLWIAFFVHDLGYWGCPEMDNEEGEYHVCFGADLVHKLFDKKRNNGCTTCWGDLWFNDPDCDVSLRCGKCFYERFRWQDFCMYHSRFMAKRRGKPVSKLCYADKLAIALEPWWLYLPRVWASGELSYYMDLAVQRTEAGEPRSGKYSTMNLHTANARQWFASMCDYLKAWVEKHKDGSADTWTPKPTDMRPYNVQCEGEVGCSEQVGTQADHIRGDDAEVPTRTVEYAQTVFKERCEFPGDPDLQDTNGVRFGSGATIRVGSKRTRDGSDQADALSGPDQSSLNLAESKGQCDETRTGTRLPWLSQTGREPDLGTVHLGDDHNDRH